MEQNPKFKVRNIIDEKRQYMVKASSTKSPNHFIFIDKMNKQKT